MNSLRQSGCLLRRCALNAHPSRTVHLTLRRDLFYEKDEKGGYRKPEDMPSRTQLIRDGFKELRGEILLWKEEMKEKLACDPLMIVRKGEVDVKWHLKSPESLKDFSITCDKDHEQGFSRAELKMSPSGKGLFTGYLDTTVPKDGIVQSAGYAGMRTARARKSFKRDSYLDWTMYNTLVIRARGDGRTYQLNIANSGYYDQFWNDVFVFFLYTRGGPYWQVSKIPFSKFMLTNKGRVQDNQGAVNLEKVSSFGITLANGVQGPFNLEIDYIGLEFDPAHNEEFAYEMYNHDNYIVAN